MKRRDFDRKLDDCLDRLERGESVAQCLSSYPEDAAELEPLLRAAGHTFVARSLAPSVDATAQARTRFRTALARATAEQVSAPRRTWLERLTARPLTLAAIASLCVICLTVLLVGAPLTPDFPPVLPSWEPGPEPPTTPGATTEAPTPPTTPTDTPPPSSPEPEYVWPEPMADGNFVFYVSDAPNDIGDFSRLVVTIDSIELKPRDGGKWILITPVESQADLVQLPGDLASELWRGDVPAGDYSAVFLNVSTIDGVLQQTGATADIMLPSERLHITTDFSVGEGGTTAFVFDITVHKTGQSGASARYVLSPQASESGTGRSVQVIPPSSRATDHPGQEAERPKDATEDDERGRNNTTLVPGPGQPHATNDPEFTV